MKIARIITILTMVLVMGSAAYAVDLSLGINGQAGSGVGTVRAGEYEELYGVGDDELNMLGGFNIAAQITFGENTSRFFIRPEAGMLFNNGLGNGFYFTYDDHTIGLASDSDCKVSIATVDIPVLLGMETAISNWMLDFYMGPYISIPVFGTVTTSAGSAQLTTVAPVFGGTAGITGNLKAGEGAFVFDMRYLFDFASTKMAIASTDEAVSVYARRNIQLSAGYKLDF